MSRILLVDDSPHAQRMGERILSDEGYEVVAVSNADSALIRLDDVDPDVVLADAVMPGRTGYDICQYLRISPRHRHVRVILTAGVLEAMDLDRVREVGADGTLNKPFEATVLLAAVKPLAEAAAAARAAGNASGAAAVAHPPEKQPPKVQAPFIAVVDDEQVRAAVTVALDAAMGAMVDEISRRVLAALHNRKPESETRGRAGIEPPRPMPLEEIHAVLPGTADRHEDPVRRVTALRLRSGVASLPVAGPTPLPHPRDPRPAAVEQPVAPAPAPAPPVPLPASASDPAAARPPSARSKLLRARYGSILGLDSYDPEPEEPSTRPRDDS
jgi:CheY-like chemotaxis protein